MTLGQQIRQARENKNLSQEELASKLGVSRQAVSKWENNSAIPQGLNREMLAQVLESELSVTESASFIDAPVEKRNKGMWFGWGLAAALFVMLCVSAGIGLYLFSLQEDIEIVESTLEELLNILAEREGIETPYLLTIEGDEVVWFGERSME